MNLAWFGLSGPQEILLIVLIILLLFGAKKLPELARSMGRSLGEFKKGRKEGNEADEKKNDSCDADSASDDTGK